jgi:hypothetical protein
VSQETEPAALVARFVDDERKHASDRLVELHRSHPVSVVDALVAGIRADDDPMAYRVNLYVAFTLGRLEPGWRATSEQLDKVRALQKSRFRGNAIFARRVREALGQSRPAG